ncbi:enoyl-CoA hydratase/isomerase family protein [Haloactinomyces albus]|uniref:2-(1,2-epoxy-1,2-dihydrophenyl)acetyl-CoA isomerase n=1 Tax=Haloactinomyces albus TaxID=1352928 RepID=A0AAE3ZBU4_9ACTN|nr:enoyl-CoA hydratase-related protein [Haloactinomyces albus]MDR7300254.1 2-(1,2-epoxy-1,2-dihydrophenyl)acetyl-CoA isomerase [Haloactinomyces albus]
MTLQPDHGPVEESVLLDRGGSILTVTLNRPHRKNAIDSRMWISLHEALCVARDNDDVRTVVITGAGGDFSAGADLGGERDEQHPLNRMHRINDIAMALHELRKPVIAKVSGVAVGAGWNLALGCDVVVASPEARFSQIFARRGLSPDFGGSWLLPRIVGLQQAKRLALLGDFIGAEEARSLGLVTWVKNLEEIDGFVAELAQRLAEGPPVALAQSKALLHEGMDQTFRQALAGEARAQAVNFATEDTATALEAFRAKTDPEFTGRWAVR